MGKNENTQLDELESELTAVKNEIMKEYRAVKDFGSADYVSVEGAMKRIGALNKRAHKIDSEIKRLKKDDKD